MGLRRLLGRSAPPAAEAEPGLPAPIAVDLRADAGALWRARMRQLERETYMGVPLLKLSEDLRVYEHLLWQARPNVVIEIGTAGGGSALWFRDRLRTLAAYGRIEGAPRVVSVDRMIGPARDLLARADPDHAATITMLEADITDPQLPAEVERHIPAGARCLVVEDSAHVYATTIAALRGFARFVEPGGWFVVEDGCVDVEELRVSDDWPRGVIPAIDDFLASPDGAGFRRRRDLELYGLTCHRDGYLQRVAAR
jgi:cephalosporin hydroxylase